MNYGQLIVGNNLHLEEGELICDKCGGKGHLDDGLGMVNVCSKCWGAGKLDWIDNAMGKKIPDFSSGSIYGSTSGTDVMPPSQKAVMDYLNQHTP